MVKSLHRFLRELCWNHKLAVFLLTIFVIGVRVASNLLFFEKHGYRSSYGGDIWFFVGVAKGYYHLFAGDPLGWILPLLRTCEPERLYDFLLVSSNIIHLISVLLLFGFLTDLTKNAATSAWSSAIYSCSMTSFNFCTGSFHHQQIAIPVLIAFLWVCSHLHSPVSLKQLIAVAFLILIGASIGPDIFVYLCAAVPCFFILKFRKGTYANQHLVIPLIILSIWILLFVLLAPFVDSLLAKLAVKMRGIDLSAQRQLNIEDLRPFHWFDFFQAYSGLSFIFLAIVVWALYTKRFFESTVFITAILFASQAARFYFTVEIAFMILLACFLNHISLKKTVLKRSLGPVILILTLWIAASRGVACLYPGGISMLSQLRKESEPKHVLCTPTYGFAVRSLADAIPTSDWHHLDDFWVRIASQPAAEAIERLRDRGINYFFFTGYDCRVHFTTQGEISTPILLSSGGFEKYLPASWEEVEKTLVYQALSEQPNIPGVKLIESRVDSSSQVRIVLFQIQ
jgi:hypothetical protein